jgi:hypothetical protein
MIKFIKKGIHFQQTESGLSVELRAMGLGGRERERHFLFPRQEMGASSLRNDF